MLRHLELNAFLYEQCSFEMNSSMIIRSTCVEIEFTSEQKRTLYRRICGIIINFTPSFRCLLLSMYLSCDTHSINPSY